MKIAIFSGSIPSSTFIEQVIHRVSEHHEVLLFGVMDSRKEYGKNVRIYKTPYSHLSNLGYTLIRLFLLTLKRPKDVLQLIGEIQRFKSTYDRWIWFSKFLPIILYRPDILHLQWARDVEFYAFLKEKFGIKTIVSLRGAHINYTPIVVPKIARLYRDFFPKVDAFHAVSEAIAKEAEHYGANPDRIRVIYSPIPASVIGRYQPFKERTQSTYNIVSVGRFHWIKGMKYAIDACNLLKERGIDFHYTIISSNSISEEILFQIHQLQLETYISVIYNLRQEDLFEQLKMYDVMLLPSLEEGIANVVIEAMALGVPVITTNCGGMSELVTPHETGWIVPIRSASALADALIEVSNTDELMMQQITTNAHAVVNSKFNADTNIQKFLKLYEAVASS